MANNSRPGHVVVVGGGVLGVSTAAHLAARGTRVTLVTSGAVADGASGRSLAWLNSAAIRTPEYHALRTLGLERYRMLGLRLGPVAWLRFDGGLAWGGPDGIERVRELARHQRAVGYPHRWVTREDVAQVVPGVEPGALADDGALFNPGEGWVDLPSLTGHLVEQYTRAGGQVRTGTGPAEVVVRADRAVGVRVRGGEVIDADEVVLATGAGVPSALADLGVTVPERTPISFLVRTEPISTGLRAVLNTPRASLRPTPDGRLVVDAGWAEEEFVRHGDGTFTVPPGLDKALLDEASEVLAGRPALVTESVHAGPKPIPGDGNPVLGPIDDVQGLSVAFTHSGATLGLIAGELLADEIVTGTPHPLLAPFRPGRFA
jgi:glycine/D-amino acid oxidase-like deaminating enzyme